MTDFDEFMGRRRAAADAYVTGDAAPLGEIVARSSPTTFFGPRGGSVVGADDVWQVYERDATDFGNDGTSDIEVVAHFASDELAYWAGFQRATATFGGTPTEFGLRVTEVFRREGGRWKLVHRHADPLADPHVS